MNRMSLRIAQRLKDAQNTYAMLTAFNEIDMRFVVLLEIESTESKRERERETEREKMYTSILLFCPLMYLFHCRYWSL